MTKLDEELKYSPEYFLMQLDGAAEFLAQAQEEEDPSWRVIHLEDAMTCLSCALQEAERAYDEAYKEEG